MFTVLGRHLTFLLALVLLWGGAAVAQDSHLELDRVEPDPQTTQFPTVVDGTVVQADLYYGVWTTTHTWTSPPAVIGAEGISISLTAAGTPPGSNLYPGTGISAPGFRVTPDPAEVFADVRVGQNSNSVMVTLVPDWSRISGEEATIKIGASFGAGVNYIYRVVAGGGDGGGGDLDGQDGDDAAIVQEAKPVLAARVECPRDFIRISELPDLSCEIVISGWTTSSYPVQVLLPGVVDGWGNQANGLQSVMNGAFNAADATNWYRPDYRWWLPVFACPSQNTTGANCQDFITLPGPVSMPIIVRQQGQADVNLLLTLNAIPHDDSAPQAGLLSAGAVRFGNVWRTGEFLNVETGTPQVGTIRADWLSAVWNVVPVSDGIVLLESVWKPGAYLHAETGRPEVGEIGRDWLSAQWLVEPVPGTAFFRLANRWQTGQYLHAEPGFLTLGPAEADWASSWWWGLQ